MNAATVATLLAMHVPPVAVDGGRCIPPARYDHPAQMTVHVASLAQLQAIFGIRYANLKGVTIPGHQVYILAGLPLAWQACVLRHERGHVNGWPGNHPQ